MNKAKRSFFEVHYGLDREVAQAHLDSLVNHIRYVREAGRTLGVPEAQLRAHDASKTSKAEFPAYARYNWARAHGLPLTGGVGDAFAAAWLHHIHANKHHWQHWIFADGYAPAGAEHVENGVLPMPECYALEMVADWLGASRAYTGSWNMTDWLNKNLPRIRLHSTTAVYVRQVLADLGYGAIISTRPFAHEIEAQQEPTAWEQAVLRTIDAIHAHDEAQGPKQPQPAGGGG